MGGAGVRAMAVVAVVAVAVVAVEVVVVVVVVSEDAGGELVICFKYKYLGLAQ
jgi:hypothetical protein